VGAGRLVVSTWSAIRRRFWRITNYAELAIPLGFLLLTMSIALVLSDSSLDRDRLRLQMEWNEHQARSEKNREKMLRSVDESKVAIDGPLKSLALLEMVLSEERALELKRRELQILAEKIKGNYERERLVIKSVQYLHTGLFSIVGIAFLWFIFFGNRTGFPRIWRIRLCSNRRSMSQAEPTVLAIAETGIATGFALLLAQRFGWQALVWAVIAAPVTLAVSDRSLKIGAMVFEPFERFARLRWERSQKEFASAIGPALVLIIGSGLARLIGTSAGLILSPLRAIAAIPRNWARIATAEDICCPPAWLTNYRSPFAAKGAGPLDVQRMLRRRLPIIVLGFVVLLSGSVGMPSSWWRTIIEAPLKWGAVLSLPLLFPLYFRFAIKMTSLVYYPLVTSVSSSLAKKVPTRSLMLYLNEHPLARIQWLFAWVACFVFVGKFVVLSLLTTVHDWLKANVDPSVYSAFFALRPIPAWQSAGALSGVLTILTISAAGYYLYLRRTGETLNETRWGRSIRIAALARNLVALYATAIAVTACLYLAKLLHLKVPPWEWVFWPKWA
jgi:hypothetical protein